MNDAEFQGNLHLTTHRLLFHAQLPPESKDTDATAADVLQSGPVTVHRHAALRPARRLWMEISSEMITTYPSGDESGRVRPLKTILCKRYIPSPLTSPADLSDFGSSRGAV